MESSRYVCMCSYDVPYSTVCCLCVLSCTKCTVWKFNYEQSDPQSNNIKNSIIVEIWLTHNGMLYCRWDESLSPTRARKRFQKQVERLMDLQAPELWLQRAEARAQSTSMTETIEGALSRRALPMIPSSGTTAHIRVTCYWSIRITVLYSYECVQ